MNINEKKDQIQRAALQHHDRFGGFSTLAMCTGSGKSRCAILKAQEIVSVKPDAKIILVCHTIRQRDTQWKLEFEEWGASDIYENNIVERVTYVSLNKIKDQEFDFVILDEAHHLTIASTPFFENNIINSIIGLTATPPVDKVKKQILDIVAPISFVYPLEQGIIDGVVAPFEIDIIYTTLESVKKTVDAGSKTKPFKQTEQKAYEYWTEQCNQRNEELRTFIAENLWPLGWSDQKHWYNEEKVKQNKALVDKNLKKKAWYESRSLMAIGKRTTLLKNSYNKTRIAKRLVNEYCRDDLRYLFFAGSIAQSNEILPGYTYNSETDSEAFNLFVEQTTNKLCAVLSVNEGENIPMLDEGIVVQLNSKELGMIQRIGRVIRVRPNHVGKIIILCIKGTRDEEWMKSAIKNLKFVKINKYTEKEFFEKNRQQELF